MRQYSVLAFSDLQVESGAFSVDHYRSGVDELLAGAVVAGKATHRAEGEEELNRLALGFATLHMDDGAEIDTVEIVFAREEVEQGPNQVRNVLVESQRSLLVA